MPATTAKIINPVLSSVIETFETMLNSSVERGAVELRQPGESLHDISALVGISGKVKGSVCISFPVETAVRIVDRFLGGSNDTEALDLVPEITPDVIDALGEVVNMVGGSAKSKLNMGLNIGLPNVVHGHNHGIDFPRRLATHASAFRFRHRPLLRRLRIRRPRRGLSRTDEEHDNLESHHRLVLGKALVDLLTLQPGDSLDTEALDVEAGYHRSVSHSVLECGRVVLACLGKVTHEAAREAVTRAGRVDHLTRRVRRQDMHLGVASGVASEVHRTVFALLDDGEFRPQIEHGLPGTNEVLLPREELRLSVVEKQPVEIL